jgi:aspartyl-tRNA(Asn)/glutamyl-tRNA(Gln) amidotransferase subunit A
MSTPLHFLTLAESAARLAAGKLSSAELTQAVIAQRKAVEPRLHAFNSYDWTAFRSA